MKNEEKINIKVTDIKAYDELKEIEEVIGILFELIKDTHKKLIVLYFIVSLLSFAVGVLVIGG